MTENPKEKKNVFSKIKENIDDKEEQMAFLGTLIRLGVMVWAGFIISLNYITLPGITEDREVKDITFIASVFTGTLATFGVQAGGKKKDGSGGGGANISKKDMEVLIEKAANTAPAQTIRIEQAPMVLAPQVPPKK